MLNWDSFEDDAPSAKPVSPAPAATPAPAPAAQVQIDTPTATAVAHAPESTDVEAAPVPEEPKIKQPLQTEAASTTTALCLRES